jgi:hypothetical protein
MSTALDALLRRDHVRWQQIRCADHARREEEQKMRTNATSEDLAMTEYVEWDEFEGALQDAIASLNRIDHKVCRAQEAGKRCATIEDVDEAAITLDAARADAEMTMLDVALDLIHGAAGCDKPQAIALLQEIAHQAAAYASCGRV